MKTLITKAVIPAAGFGTRFLPATKAQPKEMLTVVDKPVIQYVVEEAVAAGITDIIIITGQSKRAIEDHFDRNFELETRLIEQKKTGPLKEVQNITKLANFIYVRQKEMLGDGHAIMQAASLLEGEPFAVLFGDDIIDSPRPALLEMVELYDELRAPIVCTTKVPRKDTHRYGIVAGHDEQPGVKRIDTFVEKPNVDEAPSTQAVVGRYIVTPELMQTLVKLKPKKGGELRLADAIQSFMVEHPVYAYMHKGTRHDCGDKLGFLKATVELGLQHPELAPAFRRHLKKVSS